MTNRDYYFDTADITRRNMQKRGMIMFAIWLRMECVNRHNSWYHFNLGKFFDDDAIFDVWCKQECADAKQGQAT